MKKFIPTLLCTLILGSSSNVQAQSASQPRWNIASWEPALGMVFRHHEKFSAARLQIGTRNLMIKNRVGVYYILEYRGGINFVEDNTKFYFRDLLGLNYSINKSLSIHAGMGVFRKGLLQSGVARGGEYYYNSAQFGRLRKEIGLTFRIPQYPISIDLGYSTWVGPTATFGYIIPMEQKKLGNARVKSIPVYDVPVLIETKPEPETPKKVIDTIIEQVVIVDTIPEIETPKKVIDTLVEQVVVVETKPEPEASIIVESVPTIDLSALAKQSTTYYPFNVDTLNVANKENLQQLIQYLKENPNATTTVFGNADVLGSESYNLTLSESRAKNVKAYLVSQGVPANRIKVIAYGEQKAKGDSEEERTVNRCVEFKIIKE